MVREYYNAFNQFGQLNISISHETAVRQASASLLDTCAQAVQMEAGAGGASSRA